VSPRAQQVLREALQLPPKARADIAGTLLYSLDTKEDKDVEEAWAAEIERRIAEVDSGKAKLLPWSRVHRQLHAGLRRARAKR
jgi:putative addiction module component (TIGR02574 family)